MLKWKFIPYYNLSLIQRLDDVESYQSVMEQYQLDMKVFSAWR